MPRTGTHTKHVTRDDRARIRTLYYDAGFTQSRIASITGLTINQVKRSVAAKDAEIRPRSGRPPVMLAEDVDLMIEYIKGSKKGRQATSAAISEDLFKGRYGKYAIRSTLRRLGYTSKSSLPQKASATATQSSNSTEPVSLQQKASAPATQSSNSLGSVSLQQKASAPTTQSSDPSESVQQRHE
ncbi:beta-1,4-glucosidase [Beauveria bassiana ARSEF 2860]|uniref:Beta-1,4-glucosidase n=1 Tax=Beauveria bassiana (strain ARSEF 2860) TaxID=655819 RepID=J5JJM9_BEAB2|nr:beta-1,4-glucosidase [Beauveria bassiana ARSEF 2860]EJP63511.1 beta-1,4-glucosidase [Beauveria bassiana ARSEF 2860]